MSKVYDPEAFSARVNYAAACFMRGTSSRSFDTCFEMWDGDAVVVALVRRASKNEKLYAAIARRWRDGFPAQWTETANQYAGIRDLSALARELRRTRQEESDRYWAEREAARQTTAA